MIDSEKNVLLTLESSKEWRRRQERMAVKHTPVLIRRNGSTSLIKMTYSLINHYSFVAYRSGTFKIHKS